MYKNGPTSEESGDKMEEEGSAHLFKGAIQMRDFSEDDEEAQKKNRSLNKGNSLPKPSLARQYSQNIMKTLSLSPYELEKLDSDKGFKESN